LKTNNKSRRKIKNLVKLKFRWKKGQLRRPLKNLSQIKIIFYLN
jgi:hypothetical protein